jgi:hypothetical protein
MFVSVQQSTTIRTSSDGITWDTHASGVVDPLNAVTFGNNLFVVVGGEQREDYHLPRRGHLDPPNVEHGQYLKSERDSATTCSSLWGRVGAL